MYVDETMSPGQFHHPRFIGERGGRQQQCLVGENSVRSTGWSTGSLGEDLVGRIAKPNFAGACEMRSTRTATRRNRPSGQRERAGDERVSRGRRASSPGVEKQSRFALFLAKKAYYPRGPGVQSGKIDFNTISSMNALPFLLFTHDPGSDAAIRVSNGGV